MFDWKFNGKRRRSKAAVWWPDAPAVLSWSCATKKRWRTVHLVSEHVSRNGQTGDVLYQMPAAELFREPLLCLLQLGLKFRLCPVVLQFCKYIYIDQLTYCLLSLLY